MDPSAENPCLCGNANPDSNNHHQGIPLFSCSNWYTVYKVLKDEGKLWVIFCIGEKMVVISAFLLLLWTIWQLYVYIRLYDI